MYFTVGLNMYVRYRQLEEQHDVRRLNRVSFVLGVISAFGISVVANFQVSKEKPVVDPGFPRNGGANSPGRERQHTVLPNFPQNCMKLKEFGPLLDPPLRAYRWSRTYFVRPLITNVQMGSKYHGT